MSVFSLVHSLCPEYLLSRPANSEDEDEQTGREQLPYEEDDAEGQVSSVTQFITQVSLQAHTHTHCYLLVYWHFTT